MKFRPQRGGLAEAMAEMVEVDGRDGLIAHLRGLYGEGAYDYSNMNVKFYSIDKRIDWKETYIVTIPGITVLGFTDAEC